MWSQQFYDGELVVSDEDDSNKLWIGRVKKVTKGIWVGTDKHDANFDGYIMFYGGVSEDSMAINAVGRLAFEGALKEELKSWKLGVLSLEGPSSEELQVDSEFEAAKQLVVPCTSSIRYIPLSLYHQRLDQESQEDADGAYAHFPQQTETLVADLEWGNLVAGSESIKLNFSLKAWRVSSEIGKDAPVFKKKKKLLIEIEGVLDCRSPDSPEPLDEPLNSIPSHCGPPPASQGCPTGKEVPLYELQVKLINLCTNNIPLSRIEAACEIQANNACTSWRTQGPLKINFLRDGNGNPIHQADGNDKIKYSTLGFDEIAALKTLDTNLTGIGFLGVYLVEEILTVPRNFGEGGAYTHDCGKSSAFVVMAIPNAEQNPGLLAHELGHMLGLDHPRRGRFPGSEDSVMDFGGNILAENTYCNCKIFLKNGRGLNPLAKPRNDVMVCLSPHEEDQDCLI